VLVLAPRHPWHFTTNQKDHHVAQRDEVISSTLLDAKERILTGKYYIASKLDFLELFDVLSTAGHITFRDAEVDEENFITALVIRFHGPQQNVIRLQVVVDKTQVVQSFEPVDALQADLGDCFRRKGTFSHPNQSLNAHTKFGEDEEVVFIWLSALLIFNQIRYLLLGGTVIDELGKTVALVQRDGFQDKHLMHIHRGLRVKLHDDFLHVLQVSREEHTAEASLLDLL